MTVKVTILGLGQIGSSIGLALAPQKDKITRVGHDTDSDTTRAAKKKDVVDNVQVNLHSAVEGADLVILSVPLYEVRDTLNMISADLKEGAVVLDTSPARRQGEALARELLPAGRYYVGLVPAIQPQYLLGTGGGLEGARADLFQDANSLVCTMPGLPENAVRLATDLLKLIGANPIICDSTEADGLLAGMITLPKILAVSLVDVTMDKPGWADAKDLAGPPYAMPVAAVFDREIGETLGEDALANQDNLVRLLDAYLESLRAIRDHIQNEEREKLDQKIRSAQDSAYQWLAERHLEKYTLPGGRDRSKDINNPTFGDRLRQSFLGGLGNPRN